MHAEPTRPLSIAAAVLTPSTLTSVCRSPSFHRRGWQILDRWAFESPAQLRAIEAEVLRRMTRRLGPRRRCGRNSSCCATELGLTPTRRAQC